MSEWVKVNLPWYVGNEGPAWDALCKASEEVNAEVDALAREIFGRTVEASRDDLDFEFHEIENLQKEYPILNERPRDNEWLRRVGDARNSRVLALAQHWHFVARYDEWREKLPQWDRLKLLQEAASVERNARCFCRHPMCKPGMLIEVNHEGKTVQYLIGDINPAGGLCGDCRAFENEDVVLRYRELIATVDGKIVVG